MAAKKKAIPLQEVEVYDNSEIENHCKCDRMHYFRHVRHLTAKGQAKSLGFGSAWHKSMDVIWSEICWEGNKDDAGVGWAAGAAFMETWVELGFPGVEEWATLSKDEQKELMPQSPMTALEMIFEYIKQRRKFLESIELLEIERPFVVPLSPDNPSLMYSGRTDKTFKMNKRVLGTDHKTTSLYAKDGFFRSMYLESFSPNRQLEGYLHSLKMRHGKAAKAVWADLALVHRSVHDGFRFVPVEMQVDHLGAWLWETHQRIEEIRKNKQALREFREAGVDAPFMPCFPKKPEACTLYNRKCGFMDLCRMWANPELFPEVPPGYIEDPWSPFEEYQLDQLGLKEKRV